MAKAKRSPDHRRLRAPVIRMREDGAITHFESPRFPLVMPASLGYDWHEDLTVTIHFNCRLADGREVLSVYEITGWDGDYFSLTKVQGDRYAEADLTERDEHAVGERDGW